MVTRKKSTTKSVTFNQQENDQKLLAEIEGVLANKSFKSFSELCKIALQEYLSSSEIKNRETKDSNSEVINQKLSQLQRQIDGFEGTVLLEYLEPLKQQLNLLSQQFQLLEEKIEQPSNIPTNLEQQIGTSSEHNVTNSSAPEEDPILRHLTPLLEEF